MARKKARRRQPSARARRQARRLMALRHGVPLDVVAGPPNPPIPANADWGYREQLARSFARRGEGDG